MSRKNEQISLQENTEMANRHIKRCPTSPLSREMQIKSTRRHQLIPVKMATINNRRNKHRLGCTGKGAFVHCWWECQLLPHCGNSMEIPQQG